MQNRKRPLLYIEHTCISNSVRVYSQNICFVFEIRNVNRVLYLVKGVWMHVFVFMSLFFVMVVMILYFEFSVSTIIYRYHSDL